MTALISCAQIIEDGAETREKPAHIQPLRFVENFNNNGNRTSEIFHNYTGRVSDALGGRSPVVVTGRCLGGGSAINGW